MLCFPRKSRNDSPSSLLSLKGNILVSCICSPGWRGKRREQVIETGKPEEWTHRGRKQGGGVQSRGKALKTRLQHSGSSIPGDVKWNNFKQTTPHSFKSVKILFSPFICKMRRNSTYLEQRSIAEDFTYMNMLGPTKKKLESLIE